ncbi:methyl-accepting chemotaxis protein [Pseudoalteromonas sp. MMG013]|uniref:methyl-accepting chemotaxis protein n=1 Tax=Pseudoalteromonas sp. MMG013 TaxID=2822687 RepID=UPI001B37150C|nr:methyl-accepting chemotaxis protein [Pseudoalteromonas sp. MMG013]MBQ4860286.1 methyl-accepting chemotaxis protein [Pseudoalteromonas sp. MMG013]
MSLTIVQKLYAAFFAVLFLLSGTSAFVIIKEIQISDVTKEVARDDVPGAFVYMQLIDELGDVNTALYAIVNNVDGAILTYNKDKNELLDYYDQLYKLESKKPADRRVMAEIKSLIDAVLDMSNQKIINSTASMEDKLRTLIDVEQRYISKLEDMLELGANEERDDTSRAMNKIQNELDLLNKVLVVITLIAIAISVVIAWRLGSSISKRLKLVAAQAENIAQGRLDIMPLTTGNTDEIGALSSSINDMQRALTTLVGQIKSVTSEVGSSSSTLETINQQVAEGIKGQQQKADQISTAAAQMSSSIAEVAHQSVDAADIANQAGSSASHGGKIVNEMVLSIRNVSTTIQDLSDSVGNLGQRGKQIGEIIKVINEIAEQTNLLALNAAIEAARAGEQGRGFAVVADEVRGLASRTATATQEVAESISAIQQETDIAVSRMAQSTDVVDKGVSLSEEALAALEDIVSQAQTVNRMIDSVAASAEEQAAVTKEISHDIADINDIATVAVGNSVSAQSAANVLSDNVAHLEDALGKFKV